MLFSLHSGLDIGIIQGHRNARKRKLENVYVHIISTKNARNLHDILFAVRTCWSNESNTIFLHDFCSKEISSLQ